MLVQVLLEGLGLGALLVLVCAIGIRKGAVGMVHLYHQDVQDRCVKLGLTTHEKIKRNKAIFKALCIPAYIAYVLVCVYAVNGTRDFVGGFWQLLVILSVMNLIDRLLVGGTYEGLDDSRHRGHEALYHRRRQTPEVAFRHRRHGDQLGGTIRDHGADPALSAGEDRAHFFIAVRYMPCCLKHWAISISPPYCFSMPWA